MLDMVGFVKQVEYLLWRYKKMQRWQGFRWCRKMQHWEGFYCCIVEECSVRFVHTYELRSLICLCVGM